MTEAEFKKIEECNAVSDLLPLEFRNGTRIDEIGTTCGNCEKEIPSGTIRGSITKLNEHCISFHGHGICYGCKTVTLIDVRFADDGSFLCKINDSWKENDHKK
jgi:hypothetical protein